MNPADPTDIDACVDVWSVGTDASVDFLAEMGLESGMYETLHRRFAAGVADGRGDHDCRSVAERRTDCERR